MIAIKASDAYGLKLKRYIELQTTVPAMPGCNQMVDGNGTHAKCPRKFAKNQIQWVEFLRQYFLHMTAYRM